ncbi:integrase/recombinase XerD [Scopulibacillus darangshiensis]|uniref:Integrase/recombinase XerD n=1 Tax=Scopulibacillus darangshiensis TaxID=442528 RepID=A0A4R2P5S0_9BACL|nr:tyrosine-type recombinase/integrase [Scopulibacillus darangshiensis]TCP30209.1 integrase/recombinase XerD [Scopulibacillus darangshiensis]
MAKKVMRKLGRGKGAGATQKNNQKPVNMSLNDMFERFMLYKKTEGLAKDTIESYYTTYRWFREYLGSDLERDEITLDVFRDYIDFMLNEKGISPVTANVRIRTMRTFIRYCYLENYIDFPIHERFKPLKTKQDTLESFTPQEVKKLLSLVDESTYTGFRDKVIIYILLDTLVRCRELINMKRENVDLQTGAIKLEASDTKTKKSRIVPLSARTIRVLKEYMDETEDFGSEWLLVTYEGEQMANNTIRYRLTELGEKAGLTNKRVSPHTFRHTGSLFYIMNGGDPFSLQKILGHSDMSMVRKYIQMTDDTVKRQHNTFSPLKSVFN